MQRSSSTERGYGYKWQEARDGYLRKHPLCVYCRKQGWLTSARVVDHIIPHKGNMDLFWDSNNWQSLCKTHHDSSKKKMENRGVVIGGDVNGQPLDPNHHWNKEASA